MFVIVNSFSYHSSHKFEVIKMIRVVVTEAVAHIRHFISGGCGEEGVVRVEYLSSYDLIPFSQQTSCILPLFSLKNDVQPTLQLLRASPMEFPKTLLEHLLPLNSDSDIFASVSLLYLVQLLSKVPPLHVEVEDSGMVYKNLEGSVTEGRGALS